MHDSDENISFQDVELVQGKIEWQWCHSVNVSSLQYFVQACIMEEQFEHSTHADIVLGE